jgi:tetratricopeptide (TPR) repeat protein
MRAICFFRSSFLTAIFLICFQNICLSQYASSIEQAKQYYNIGLTSYSQKNYQRSIDNFLISIAEFPEAITYYALVSAYAKNGDWKNAGGWADYIGTLNPPLPSAFYSSLGQIKTWVKTVRTIYANPAPGLMGIPSSPDVKMPTEDWFNSTPANLNSSIVIEDFYFPRKQSESGSQFATVNDNNNNIKGSIHFFGFQGGKNLGNGKTSAETFSVGLSASSDPSDLSSYTQVVFLAKELYPGSVKFQTIGSVSYNIIIIGVEKNSPDSYILNSVRIQVKAYL